VKNKIRAGLWASSSGGEEFVPHAHFNSQPTKDPTDGQVVTGNKLLHVTERFCVDVTPHDVRVTLETIEAFGYR